jgi:hypothetical protein
MLVPRRYEHFFFLTPLYRYRQAIRNEDLSAPLDSKHQRVAKTADQKSTFQPSRLWTPPLTLFLHSGNGCATRPSTVVNYSPMPRLLVSALGAVSLANLALLGGLAAWVGIIDKRWAARVLLWRALAMGLAAMVGSSTGTDRTVCNRNYLRLY